MTVTDTVDKHIAYSQKERELYISCFGKSDIMKLKWKWDAHVNQCWLIVICTIDRDQIPTLSDTVKSSRSSDTYISP